MPKASTLRAPNAWGLPGQYDACHQETRECGDDGHAWREQGEGRLAQDRQEERIRPSHRVRTRGRPWWLRLGENRRKDLPDHAVEREGEQVVVRLGAKHGDVGTPVLDPLGMLRRSRLDRV